MSRYKKLDAIIESKKMDLEPRMTQNPDQQRFKEGISFYSSVENSEMTEF